MQNAKKENILTEKRKRWKRKHTKLRLRERDTYTKNIIYGRQWNKDRNGEENKNKWKICQRQKIETEISFMRSEIINSTRDKNGENIIICTDG